MARVTKINVGGTNYDIAHEGELKNSGFEVVTSLPTTGLFKGREVVYKGIKYVYNNGWRSQYNPVNFPRGVTLRSSTEELTNASTVIELNNFELSQIPELLNKSLFVSNNTNVVKQSERLYELIDNETGDITVLSGLRNPVIGQTLRYTAINPSGSIGNLHMHLFKINGSPHAVYCVYIPQNVRYEKVVYKIEYYIYTNVTGDGDYNNKANYEWKTVFKKELKQFTEIIYPRISSLFTPLSYTYTYIYNVRVSITPTTKVGNYDIDIKDIDILYYGLNHKSPVNANRLINFDAVIEPTQTSTEFKSPLWLWQYLVQGVNWLKANKVALSVYNAKVAELVQADNSNNAYIQAVKEELTALIDEVSGGLANLAAVARSGSYNDLIDTPVIPSTFEDLGGNLAAAQISEGSIGNSKLANSSMTLNDTTVNLGDTAILPWYVTYNGVDYPARLQDNWLQIYRNEVWANLLYLASQEPALPTEVVQITSFANLDWYNKQVSEYEIDSNTTFELLDGKFLIASQLLQCPANQLTLNLFPIPSGRYSKGALDNVISDLQGKKFAVFVENDLDTILTSGNDFCVRIKISKVPTYKAIIECYVAR